MTVQRREILALGCASALAAVPLQQVIAAAACLHEEEALIGEFRKVVRSLREATSENIPPSSSVAEVRRLGKVLREHGITRIIPRHPVDRACNHWLANIQRSSLM
jgi:hypothetical protein